jgi:type IV pili sensor histidine kinase/response regulator
MGKVLSFLVVSSLLGGLAGFVQGAELNQGYVVSNQGALGITRAFDDGDNTVLAFVDLDNQHPALTDSAGKKIRFRQVGDFAVLPGKFDLVHVSVGQDYGVVRLATLQPPVSSPAAIGDERVLPATTAATANAKTSGERAATTLTEGSAPMATVTTGKSSPGVSAPGTASNEGKPTATTTSTKPAPSLPAPPAKAAEAPKPVWRAAAGTSLRSSLQSWADQAGWQLRWEYGQDFPIDMPIQFTGSFKEAVTEFIRAYGSADLPPHVCAYPDQQPKPLMRVIASALKCDE